MIGNARTATQDVSAVVVIGTGTVPTGEVPIGEDGEMAADGTMIGLHVATVTSSTTDAAAGPAETETKSGIAVLSAAVASRRHPRSGNQHPI